MTKDNQHVTRRNFVKRTALASSAFMIVGPEILGRGACAAPSDKLNIAAIGAAGRGGHNLRKMDHQNIVALCDVDLDRAKESLQKYERAKKYRDFRKMLDKQKDIDAVIVSTPDHIHTVAAMNAIKRGKHVYVEKPLAHTIYEVRALMKAARENKVQTQLGNQGHSDGDIRKICEWIWDGAIGQVKEVHAWYSSPYGDGKPHPAETPKIPDTLDWDLWLGPVSYRPYNPCYLPRIWRSWADFGTGVLGDWVCHILDPTFWALKLQAPQSITAKNGGGDYSPERFPICSEIEYQFAARENMAPVKVTWTYGKKVDLPQLQGIELNEWNAKAGAILIGEKGSILHGSHGGGGARIIPKSRDDEYKKPSEIIPRIKEGHHNDWIRACKDGKPASSTFEYGGPLTELALLGVIATVFDGEKLEWNSAGMQFNNNPKANAHLTPYYRSGWEL